MDAAKAVAVMGSTTVAQKDDSEVLDEVVDSDRGGPDGQAAETCDLPSFRFSPTPLRTVTV